MIASLSNDCVWSASICPSSDDGFLSYYQFPYKRPPFEGGRECNPDEGFQRPRPTFLSKDLSGGRDCYSDEGFAAKAHLLLKRPPFYYVFISGRVHIPMKVSWPMPTFLTNKTTYTRGPRLLSRLRFQAVMAHLIFLPLRRGGFLNPRWIGALCPPSHCNEVLSGYGPPSALTTFNWGAVHINDL